MTRDLHGISDVLSSSFETNVAELLYSLILSLMTSETVFITSFCMVADVSLKTVDYFRRVAKK